MLPLHQKERYKYYGIEYRMPVKDMAAAAKVSLRFQKDVLKLHGLGYEAANRCGVDHEARHRAGAILYHLRTIRPQSI